MSNRTFFLFVLLCIGLGAVAGYELSRLPKLEPNKLFNLAGQSYTLLAVLVLSELITSSQKWRKDALSSSLRSSCGLVRSFPSEPFWAGLSDKCF